MNPIDYGCVCACLSMGLISVVFAVCFARALWPFSEMKAKNDAAALEAKATSSTAPETTKEPTP